MRPEDFRAGAGTASPPVIIELGTDRGEPDGYGAPAGHTVPGWLAPLLVALFVVVSSSASAAPPQPPLSALLSLRVDVDDSYALTDDGMLLLHRPADGTLTGYELSTGRKRWQASAPLPSYRLRSGAGLVLLRPRGAAPDLGTVALSTQTGKVRWRIGGRVLTIAGAPTVLGLSDSRTLSGGGRRVDAPVTGIDPESGRARWSVPVPGSAVLLGVPAEVAPSADGRTPAGAAAAPRVLLVHDGGLAQTYDLTTGRAVAAAQLPPAGYDTANPSIAGGTLLVRHPGPTGPEISGYDLATLQRRWTQPAVPDSEVRPCGELACLVGRSGVRAVDPADGTQRWHRPAWRTVEQRGGVVLAYEAPTGNPRLVGAIDPGTGQVTTGLQGWRLIAGGGATGGLLSAGGVLTSANVLGGTVGGGEDHVLATRTEAPGARTMAAVVHPGAVSPLPLGDLPAGAGECQNVPHRLICRPGSGELVVWSYSWR